LRWRANWTSPRLPCARRRTCSRGRSPPGGNLSHWLTPRTSDVLLAGVFTGFLPCGLVCGFLALASNSGHFSQTKFAVVPELSLENVGARHARMAEAWRRAVQRARGWEQVSPPP